MWNRRRSERNLLVSLRQPFRLWKLARRLRLAAPSTARLFGAYYFGRRPLLRRIAPKNMVIDIPGWGKVHMQDSVGVVKVPRVSMWHVMRQMGWGDIDLLKLDIEGAERFLLTENNSWLDKVRAVVGEGQVNVGYSYAQL